jgi:hypothetical protein
MTRQERGLRGQQLAEKILAKLPKELDAQARLGAPLRVTVYFGQVVSSLTVAVNDEVVLCRDVVDLQLSDLHNAARLLGLDYRGLDRGHRVWERPRKRRFEGSAP